MKLVSTPFALGRTIVLVGLIPAVGLGSLYGVSMKPVNMLPADQPSAEVNLGNWNQNDGRVYKPTTPVRVTPTPTPQPKLHTTEVTNAPANKVAAAADDPSSDPTEVDTRPVNQAPRGQAEPKGNPTHKGEEPPNPSPTGSGSVGPTQEPGSVTTPPNVTSS
jgi:hypothetical protein